MASGPFSLARLAKAAGMSIDEVRSYRDRGFLQPPRRHRDRAGRLSFHTEHVERLEFIKRALSCGFTHEDIATFIDPAALLTCGDVYTVANRRLEAMRAAGKADTQEAACLSQISEQCTRVGTRWDCKILEALSGPGS